MRLELTADGAILNEHGDDVDVGEWYPADTQLAHVDANDRGIGTGPKRVSPTQADDWPARAGRTWSGGRWVEAEPGAVLMAYKRVLSAEIDQRAGDVRGEYITSVDGQEGTYLVKREQAQAYIAAGTPEDTTEYPLVQARADAYGETPAVAAQTILARAALWIGVAAPIERERERGKRLVLAAVDETAGRAERDSAYAALDALRPQ